MIHSMNNNAESRVIAKSGVIGALVAALAVAAATASLVLAPAVSSAAEAKKQEISRAIAKEMTAAQGAAGATVAGSHQEPRGGESEVGPHAGRQEEHSRLRGLRVHPSE